MFPHFKDKEYEDDRHKWHPKKLRPHLLTFPEPSLLRVWSKDQQYAVPGSLLEWLSLRSHYRPYKSESAFNVTATPRRLICMLKTEKFCSKSHCSTQTGSWAAKTFLILT